MKLLWLTPEAPGLRGTGGAVRSYHQVRAVAAAGHEVTLVAPVYAEQREWAAPLAGDGIRLELVDREASQPREAVGSVLKRPSTLVSAIRDPWLGLQADVFWTALAPVVARVGAV